MSDTKSVVVSFITRIGLDEAGEEVEEVLFFTPNDKRQAPHPHPDHFEFAFMDPPDSALADKFWPAKANPKLDLCTRRSYANIQHHTNILRDELIPIRRSKTILTSGFELDVFLYRLSESYHRGLTASHGRSPFGGELNPPEGMSLEEEEQWIVDVGEYQLQEERLGLHWHRWTSRDWFEMPFSIQDEYLTTAFWSVFLSHELEMALFTLSDAAYALSATELVELSLEVLYATVDSHVGQFRFRHWPPGFPPMTEEMTDIPQVVIKLRMYRYWLDVVAHYLITTTPSYATLLSATFLRVLQPLTLLVVKEDVSTGQFELAAVKSIAAELARGELARVQISKLACGRILQAGSQFAQKRDKVGVIALGGNELVYSTLRELIHAVTTLTVHPYSALHPSVGPMLKADEERFNALPRQVHITLGETGPSLAGLTLARNLYSNHNTSLDQANELRDRARSRFRQIAPVMDDPELEPPSLAEKLKLALNLGEEDGLPESMRGVGSLRELVDEAERLTRAECQVVIELVPDGALANAVRGAASDAVILLGADGVRPEEANTICRMGSRTLAECTKRRGKKRPTVYALASTAAFQSNLTNEAWEPTIGTTDDMFSAWEASFRTASEQAATSITDFAIAAADEKNKVVRVTNTIDELVPGELIDCWITEAGLLSAEGCAALSRERSQAELLMFGRPRVELKGNQQ